MRYLLILILLISCKLKTVSEPVAPVVVKDTVYIPFNVPCDTPKPIFIAASCDSFRRVNDSLYKALFNANYKIERVRYYLSITLRNPTQDKFLKGWVRRAID